MEKSLTTNELAVLAASGQELTVLDVRRKEDFDKDPQCLAHAQWKDPTEIDQWLPSIAADREVVIYCMRGGLVSQSVQQRLAESGLKARYVEGGLEAMKLADQG